MALTLFYSSGTSSTNVFQNEVGLSLGGFMTATQIQENDGINNLFATVSNSMVDGKYDDYKMIFLKNDLVVKAGFSVYMDVPLLAVVTNPSDLVPVMGDKWIVPEGGEGDWLDKDAKWATYDGSEWTFKQQPSSDFEFGFVAPISKTVIIDGGSITDNYVSPTEYPQEMPYNIAFTSADGVGNIIQIGDGALTASQVLGVWIRRRVKTLKTIKGDYNSGEGGISFYEELPLVFSWD